VKSNTLQEPISWSGVDVGGDTLRWCRASLPLNETPELLEAPTLVSLGSDPCFVQAAQRLRSRAPEWSCHHLISLVDFATPRPHRDLIEAQQELKRLQPQLVAQEGHLPPLTPLLSPRPSDTLSLMTARGERHPTAILSELLSELLTPPQVLGGPPPSERSSQALLWLNAPSESPYRRATVAHILSELSAQHVASVDRSAAISLGLHQQLNASESRVTRSPQLWAILDLGATQGALSIVRVNHEAQSIEVLAQRGRSGIGAHLLERRLLQGRLSLIGQSWAGLSVAERAQRSIESQERTYWALRQAWPQQLSDARYAKLSSHELSVTQRYLEELNQLIARWLRELLAERDLLLESLDGLWITGAVGLALRRHMSREHPNIRVRYAPDQVAMRGLASVAQGLHTGEGYTIQRPLGDELWLTSSAHPPCRLLASDDPAPGWVDHLISPSEEVTALWLYSDASPQPTLWATHPPFSGAPRRLQLAYESPYAAHLSWRSLSGALITPNEGSWSLSLPHHPHIGTHSSLSVGALS